MLRRRLLSDKRVVLCIFLIIIIISSIVISTKTKATASDTSSRNKYFKSIEIKAGDTLWNIASTYVSEEYESVKEYVSELKNMNGLKGDTIYSGQNLVITYYDSIDK